MTININLTELFIYTLVFFILTSIIYYIITLTESKKNKITYRRVNIFISSGISLIIMLMHSLFSDIHFTFTF